MGELSRIYYNKCNEIYKKILDTQMEKIERASEKIAEHFEKEKLLYVIGTGGHCNRAAEEMLYRAGGFATVAPILDAGLALINGATRAGMTERMEGYAKNYLDYYNIKEGDLLLIVNAYGINALSIDTVHECNKRGIEVIAISSFEFPDSVPKGHPARHTSNENLHEIVELTINNFVPEGDAVVDVENFPYKIAAISTLADVFILNLIVCETVDIMLKKGLKPPVWVSANATGGDAWNKEYLNKYRSIIRHL